MFKQFHDWLENRRVKKMGFTTAQWESAIADWPVMRRYTDAHTRHGKAGICSETFFETPEKMKEKCRRSIGYSASSTASSQYHWRWQACKPQRF